MISVDQLTFRFGTSLALDRVCFDVGRGQILGLLGPNGAGKTTLMRLLTTYLSPAQGTATVAGFDVVQSPLEVRRRIGYLPEALPLYVDMRVDEYLAFVASARALSRSKGRERLLWVRDKCALSSVWKHNLYEASKGYQQRVGLAQALLHDPEVLILDEPTSGLDPLQIIDVRNLIRELAREKTVLFSTHILQEAETLADRIVIIHEGKLVADGTRHELVERAAQTRRLHAGVHEEGRPSVREVAGEKRWLVVHPEAGQMNLEEAFITLLGREEEKR